MNVGAATYSAPFGNREELKFYFDPAALAQLRFYVNQGRRAGMGKRTEWNNMNYVGAAFQYLNTKMPLRDKGFEQVNRRPVYMVGALYGLQRNYSNRFSLDLNFGPGVYFVKDSYMDFSGVVHQVNQSNFTIMGQIFLGIWIGKK